MIEAEPGNEVNYFKRFRLLLRKLRMKEALSDLSSALKIKPTYEAALVQRAKLYLKTGKCSEAAADFQTLERYVALLVIGESIFSHQLATVLTLKTRICH